MDRLEKYKQFVAVGWTLTGVDSAETGASTNAERIEAIRKLHDAGFKTWASIEPIIDFESSREMIYKTQDWCDLYKIGLESGKNYQRTACNLFVNDIVLSFPNKKIYFKDSLLKAAGINRSELPNNCVGVDYNIFNP